MAVKIGIDADVSGLKRGMRDIQSEINTTQQGLSSLGKAQVGSMQVKVDTSAIDAAMTDIDRLAEAMAKTGQLGSSLKDVKFNTKGAQEYQKILFDVQRNLAAINRTAYGKDILNRAKGTGQDEGNPLNWDWNKMFPDRDKMEKKYQEFMAKLVHGAKYEPPKAPAWEKPTWKEVPPTDSGKTPGGGTPSGAGGGSGFLGSAWGTLRSGIGFGLGLAGIQSIGQIIGGGLSRETSKRESLDTLFKTSNESWVPLEGSIKGLSDALMLTEEQAAKLATEYMRVANVTGDFTKSLEVSGQFGRGFGLDPGQAAQTFGRASAVGYGADRNSQREFAGLLANTITSSNMVGRSEQVMGDMVGQLQKIADEQGRTLSQTEMEGFARTLSGIYGSGPAMSGRGASNVLGGFASLGSGGSEANQLFLWQAYSHSMPQSRQSHIGLQKFMGADIFDEVAPGMTKLQAIWDELQKYAEPFINGGTKREDALAYVMNQLQPSISMQKGTSMVRAMDAVGKEKFGEFLPWVQNATGKSFDDVAPGAWKSLTGMFNDQSPDSWRKVAKQYSESPLISPDNAKDLKEAIQKFDEGNQSALQSILPKIVATTGMPETQADRDRDAQAKLTDALTDLTKPIKDLKTVIEEKLAPAISSLAGFAQRIADVFSPKPEPGQAPETGIDSVAGTFFRGGAEAYDAMGWARPDQYLDDVHKLILDPIGNKLKGGWDKAKNSTFGRGIRSLGENIRESAGWIGDHVIGDAEAKMGARDYPGEGLRPAQKESTGIKGAQPVSGGNLANTPFGKLIARGEGDYNSVNRGKAGGYRSGRENLEDMTVSEVMYAQKNRKFNAAGRYQIIRETMLDAYKSLKLTGDEKFDRKTQDRIFEDYLAGSRRPAIRDYISGRSDNIKGAVLQASQEWASVASPITGRSYYHGKGNNRASIGVREMEWALRQTRASMARRVDSAPALAKLGDVNNNNGVRRTDRADLSGMKFKAPESSPVRSALPITSDPGGASRPPEVKNNPVPEFFAGGISSEAQQIRVPEPPTLPVRPDQSEQPPSLPQLTERDVPPVGAFKTELPPKLDTSEAPPIPEIDASKAFAKAPPIPEMNAPKTPEKLDSLMASNSLQDPLNVRLSGQQEVRFILENDRGDVLHERNVPLVSEPSLHGSAGAHAFGERRFYNPGNAYR